MTQGKRVALSAAQRTELRSRWKEGQGRAGQAVAPAQIACVIELIEIFASG
jgi:hypothetical protein